MWRGYESTKVLEVDMLPLKEGAVASKKFMSIKLGVVFALLFMSLNSLAGNDGLNEEGKNGEHYYYEMTPKKVKALIKKVHALKKGMSIEQVINILGKPDEDEVGARKSGEFITRELVYRMKIWEKDFVNDIRDSYVVLYFDKNNVLTEYEIVGLPPAGTR